ELDLERRFVWTAVTQDMLERHDVTVEEVEGLIDILRRTSEAEVTCVIKEEPVGHGVRVSLRSLGEADVRAIAESQGGGGHRFAAGFESMLPIPEVVERIRAAL
ncbi:MAG: DHHA1 domain-containing protein, partial [Acidimicrobiia bacterium]